MIGCQVIYRVLDVYVIRKMHIAQVCVCVYVFHSYYRAQYYIEMEFGKW